MNNEVRILKSYSKVWKIERVFYQIGGVNLPNPVALNTLLYFLVFEVLMYLLKNFPIISLLPGYLKHLFIPGGLAWLCNNKLLDGKNPFSFVKTIVVHYAVVFMYGTHINRYKYVNEKGTAKYTNKISYRTIENL